MALSCPVLSCLALTCRGLHCTALCRAVLCCVVLQRPVRSGTKALTAHTSCLLDVLAAYNKQQQQHTVQANTPEQHVLSALVVSELPEHGSEKVEREKEREGETQRERQRLTELWHVHCTALHYTRSE